MASVTRSKTSPANGDQPTLLSRMKSRITIGKGRQNAGTGPIAGRKLTTHDFRIIRTLGTGMRFSELPSTVMRLR